MSRTLLSLSATMAFVAGTAGAEAPQVAVDIAPIHSLVARVMDGVGQPALIVAPGASPHEYSLRPSDAGALQEAEVVFWLGPDLTPWLEDALDTLAGQADVVELLQVDGTVTLPVRESALFEAHDHAHGSGGHDDHAHDDDHADHEGDGEKHAHAESEHEHEHAHDHEHEHDHETGAEHGESAEGHAAHDHGHGGLDPHAWLSPDNAATWLTAIAATLSEADPANAEAYRENAAAGVDEISALKSELDAILDPVRGGNFIVFHDAYQYFEDALNMPAAGAISVSDAADPSPARIAEIQARVRDEGVTCVLSEPQFAPGIVDAVMEDAQARTDVLDPLGSDLEPGRALYPQLLRNLATTLAECL